MNKQLNITVCALVAIFTASSVGCGSSFRSGSNSDVSANTTSSNGGMNDQVTKAQAAVTESQKAMESASIAINGMNGTSGTIDLSIFEPQNGATGGVLAPIIAKLKPVFDQVFSKVQMAKDQFDASKAAIATELAKLDPADPMYKLLSDELAALTKLETQFDTQVHALADRLTLVNSQIDALVAKATAYIPIPGISIIAGLFIDTFIVKDVKDLITSLHDKLMAL